MQRLHEVCHWDREVTVSTVTAGALGLGCHGLYGHTGAMLRSLKPDAYMKEVTLSIWIPTNLSISFSLYPSLSMYMHMYIYIYIYQVWQQISLYIYVSSLAANIYIYIYMYICKVWQLGQHIYIKLGSSTTPSPAPSAVFVSTMSGCGSHTVTVWCWPLARSLWMGPQWLQRALGTLLQRSCLIWQPN